MKLLAHYNHANSKSMSAFDTGFILVGVLFVFLIGVLLGVLISRRNEIKDAAKPKRPNGRKK
jgi:hypothetical protein